MVYLGGFINRYSLVRIQPLQPIYVHARATLKEISVSNNPLLEEVMNINVDNIRERQFSALKKHTLEVLDRVRRAIDAGLWDEVDDMLFFSRAGDDYGSDNYCIDFGYDTTSNPLDLHEVVFSLRRLHPNNTAENVKMGGSTNGTLRLG